MTSKWVAAYIVYVRIVYICEKGCGEGGGVDMAVVVVVIVMGDYGIRRWWW